MTTATTRIAVIMILLTPGNTTIRAVVHIGLLRSFYVSCPNKAACACFACLSVQAGVQGEYFRATARHLLLQCEAGFGMILEAGCNCMV